MPPTLERLRFVGKCLAVIMPIAWLCWFAPFDDLIDRSGAAWGGDYVMLYAAGQTIAAGESATLYDDALNQQRTSALVPGIVKTASWPFRYPPFTAAMMAPLSRLPYAWSFGVFLAISIGILGWSLRVLLQTFPAGEYRRAVMWAAVGWPVTLEVLIGGQTSIVALGILVATVQLLRGGRQTLAGAALALALYKPNILGLFAIGFMVRYPRAILGALCTGAGVGLLSVLVVGWDGVFEYVYLASNLSTAEWSLETPFWKVHGLESWLALCVGEHARALTTGLGLVLVVMISMVWRKQRDASIEGWLALLLVVNALFNPYVPIYDLVLLLPAAVFAWQSTSPSAPRRWAIATVAFGIYFGPHLSQACCKALQTDLQLFPLFLVAAVAMVAGLLTPQMTRRQAFFSSRS